MKMIFKKFKKFSLVKDLEVEEKIEKKSAKAKTKKVK